MLTKFKIKQYLKTKETMSLFDDLLSFYTTIYMKDVLRFWGCKKIKISVLFENETPVLMDMNCQFCNKNVRWSFNETTCTGIIDNISTDFSMNSFVDLNQLFNTIRDMLP